MRTTIKRLLSTTPPRLYRAATRGSITGGMFVGLYGLAWWHQTTAAFGTSLVVTTAAAVAAIVAVELGWQFARRHEVGRHRAAIEFGCVHFAMAAWTGVFPLLIAACFQWLGTVNVQTIQSIPLAMAVLVPMLTGLLGVPLFLAVQVPWLHSARWRQSPAEQPDNSSGIYDESAVLPRYLVGIAVGILLGVFVIAPLISLHAVTMFALVFSCGTFLHCLASYHRLSADEASSMNGYSDSPDVQNVESAEAAPELSQDSHRGRRFSATWQTVRSGLGLDVMKCALATLLLGSLVALLERIVGQLIIAAPFVMYTTWAAVLVGFAIGVACTRRLWIHGPRDVLLRSAWMLCPAVVTVLLLAGFSKLVDWQLAASAFIAPIAATLSLRGLFVACVFVPIGAAWGGIVSSIAAIESDSNNRPDSSRTWFGMRKSKVALQWRRPVTCFAATFIGGYLMIRWLLPAGVGTGTLSVVGVYILAAVAVLAWLPTRPLPGRFAYRCALVAGMVIVAAAPLAQKQYDPARSARLLFSTNVFVAKRAGFEQELLPFLDEARLLSLTDSRQGTLSLWRYRGSQIHVRQNGVPKAVVVTDPRICPQYSAEMMQAVLPMVLHDRPHQVLMLGLTGGVPLTTCLSFPVQHVTCVEPDVPLVEAVARDIWKNSSVDPLSDVRVSMVHVDPVLAITCNDEPVDVIIDSPPQAALSPSTPHYTLEFYRRAAARLAPDGLFCQRFQQVDFGAEPLRTIAATMQREFREVIAVETAPGESLLIGSNAEQGVVRDGVVDRLRADHVRRALASLGWDWSIPLNLVVHDHAGLQQFVEAGHGDVNSVGSGRFAFQLPQEVLRWGAKQSERRSMLAGYASRFLEWPNVDGEDPAVLHRLSEVAGQRKLMSSVVDQPWAYRKALKQQLKKGAGSIIKQAGYDVQEGEMHPIDKFRKEYCEVLGQAVEQEVPDESDIEKLASFADTYDPLVSYFVHHEVAELYSRTESANPPAEMYHRLHAAYYADPSDRSVRNVVQSLQLLVEHPEIVSAPQNRWDELNALIQVLKRRWENRGAAQPVSIRFELNDIDKSISAVQAAVHEMDELQSELEVAETDWQARRRVIEKTLIRPLRTHRSNLLTRHIQEKKKMEALLESEGVGK